MKKIFVLLITLFFFAVPSIASHISGGELFYEYQGPGSSAGTDKYKITIRLFSDCHPIDPATSQLLEDEIVVIGIYDNNGLKRHSTLQLELQLPIPVIELNTSSIPCLTSAPDVCFRVGVFTGITELPVSEDGYTLSWIRCCRPNNIRNLGDSEGVGATFTTVIPGQSVLPAAHNSSPQFAIKDTALVCQNKNFVLDFGATDPDGDSISYSLCDAYKGGTIGDPNPGGSGNGSGIPINLSLTPLPYSAPYSGSSPLGTSVTINPATGKITGIAPTAGRYVINVCATEWRNGAVINIHRKDFILEVGNCDFVAAEPLPLSGVWCDDFAVKFSNNNTSSTVERYHWDFGLPNATSEDAAPVYTYPDTGVYTIKLTVYGARGCVDEDTTTIGVYPGLKADFSVTGSCFQTPFNFTDLSTSRYGPINSWQWDFGDVSTTADVSDKQNSSYTYADSGVRNVKLVVSNNKGCFDTTTKAVEVKSVALLKLPFKDTLICDLDSLSLNATGSGTFTWTPAYNIINPSSSNPVVFPKRTTTYVLSVTDQGGCKNSDSVRVNVIDSITVDGGIDTSICRTDSIALTAEGSAIHYNWTPSIGVIGSPDMKNVLARPDITTSYIVTGNIGICEAKDTVNVQVTDYPRAVAGTDAIICFGNSTQLSGNITGSSFTWSPENSLTNSNTLTPLANPTSTTSYILTVYDTLGCPKPGRDTVVVTVDPPVMASAGNDTAVIAGQPIQLNASGGTTYTWTPSTGMNNPSVADPIVILSATYDSVTYKVKVSTTGGCFAEDDVTVRVFKTGPDIFIPTAFTPNGDGRNDILKPIPVGITTFNYFRIYNRWGQMVYSSSNFGSGWDGTVDGKQQGSGTYVFMARAIDFQGHVISKKGTIILIR
jgi:gliding motility-associated-like protein